MALLSGEGRGKARGVPEHSMRTKIMHMAPQAHLKRKVRFGKVWGFRMCEVGLFFLFLENGKRGCARWSGLL